MIANLAGDGPLKPTAKQQTGDDSPVTGDPTPRTQGLERQGRRDGRPGPFCVSTND